VTQAAGHDNVWCVAVRPKSPEYDVHGRSVLQDVHDYGLAEITSVASARLFFLKGDLDAGAVRRIGAELLADPVTESFTCEAVERAAGLVPARDTAIEVHLKPGVMDPVAASTIAAIRDMDLAVEAVRTARRYAIAGATGIEQLEFVARRILANDCIEEVYLRGFGRDDEPGNVFRSAPVRPFELRHVAIRDLDGDTLRKLSREAHLFLSLEEMNTIQAHFRDAGRDPTDLELEMLAQTWSEHCVHKTLKSAVVYRGEPMPSGRNMWSAASGETAPQSGEVEIRYDNLLRDTIARATHELIAEGKTPWCLSVFEDNAGVIEFDETYGIAFKVETHNHPSAIEPYGGAATGIGGVIRDVMGCGLGAKPIANTDVFCVGMPDFPMDLLPTGVLHPRRILKGIVAGVRDYGNRMGIPTVNGAVYFDPRYMGNPLVFCGCIGLIPRDMIKKRANPGDLVVVVGGRTGRDGIHGATFSSAELTDSHADEFSHAVQIGNAITEKKVLDTQLQARDHEGGCLYTAVTDCGAGGLSSAVGEMGAEIGAVVDLEKVPLKYAGLRYDEIWISEAQERMVLAVPPANWPKVKAIFDAEDVEATVIGTFGNSARLTMRYEGKVVGDLSAEFLHHGIPKTQKTALWKATKDEPNAQRKQAPSEPNAQREQAPSEPNAQREQAPSEPNAQRKQAPLDDIDPVEELKRRLSDLNAASKEWIIRQYDHEVQGASAVKPLVGPHQGPSDAAVIRPRLDSNRGIAIGCGMCPHLADIDPYWMAVHAIDEAIRNVVCVGGDPARTAILDNFCWGNCEDPLVMGALVRACQGCYDAAKTYGVPFISGKDSLNNEFAPAADDVERLRGYLKTRNITLADNRLRIPGTLMVSAISLIGDVTKCVTADAKAYYQNGREEESAFFLLGLPAGDGIGFSLDAAAKLHREVHRLIRSGAVLAVHDFSGEGYATSMAEMAIGGTCAVEIHVDTKPPWAADPFVPWASGYVLQSGFWGLTEHVRRPLCAVQIGIGTGDGAGPFTFVPGGRKLRLFPKRPFKTASVSIEELREAWRAPLRW
jgi:phosphoribosylformylglycinamidine (FGAM) synthase-like enzyme/phosphoribosylformylglycinamidine (FGAM) synthase PurS component